MKLAYSIGAAPIGSSGWCLATDLCHVDGRLWIDAHAILRSENKRDGGGYLHRVHVEREGELRVSVWIPKEFRAAITVWPSFPANGHEYWAATTLYDETTEPMTTEHWPTASSTDYDRRKVSYLDDE